MHTARRMWSLYEPVHAVTYFADACLAAAQEVGYRGFWMSYVAMRAAPLGPVGPEVVTASFFGFSPSRIARALPAAWTFAPPGTALQARLAGVHAVLVPALGDAVAADRIAEAAELAATVASAANTAGRPLAAANAALPRPGEPVLDLWQSLTTLREHRGDGHNAALVAAGIGPVEAHVLKEASGESEAGRLRATRDWSEEQWDEAADRLRDRGWLDAAGTLTALGSSERAAVEERTDRAAAAPWDALGAKGTERLAELLVPMASAVLAVGAYRVPNPIGAPPPAER